MKKACLSFLLFLFWGFSHAQIAQWLIPPAYDNVNFTSGANLIVADSANAKVYFNPNGQRLFTTAKETLHAFSDGCAILTNDSSSILGIYDAKGNLLTSFNNRKVKVANDFPHYSDGYLIVKKNRYYFVDKQGVVDKTQHLRIYPFRNGYAVCRDYENPQKKTGTANYLVDTYKKEVPMICKGKTYYASDIDFISSVNDEKVAFVIIKKSIFVFDAKTRLLNPLCFPNSSKQAKLKEAMPLSFDNPSNTIYAQCGKNEQITIYLDHNLVPTDISYNDEKHHYTVDIKESAKPKSSLQLVQEGNLYGLSCNGKTVIPAQFEAIGSCSGDLAIAKKAGKQGILKVVENAKPSFTINDGKAVAFRHQTRETTLQLEMPANFDPSKVGFVTDENSPCIVDKTTMQNKMTTAGMRTEYNCTITIPATVTDESAEFDYPVQMSYDGITLLPIATKAKAWRDNYYDIVINDSKKVYDKKNGTISFPYTIEMERLSTEGITPFELEATPNYLEAEIQEGTTTEGVCIVPVSKLEDGENYLFIELTEQGCPPVSFPFTITYTAKKQPTKANFKISKTTQDIED